MPLFFISQMTHIKAIRERVWLFYVMLFIENMFLQDKNKDLSLKETSEQIEDRVDEAIFEEAYEEYLKNGKKSRPISELWKEAGI